MDTSTLLIQGGAVLLLLTVIIRLVMLLKGECRRQSYELQQLELMNDYWQHKSTLSLNTSKQQRWNGVRVFSVADKVRESDDIYSFYLKPHDGKPLPSFHPGQYLTIQIEHPQSNKRLTRCYSLSDSHSSDYYRISVKKEPEGLVSRYLHEQLHIGDILEAKAPSGDFYLDTEIQHPIVLIAGGVGITPLLSMVNTLISQQDTREVHLFYGVRNGSQIMMKPYFEELAEQHPHFNLHLCYSKPNSDDRDFQHQGRVTIDLLKSILPASNYHYYLCASIVMMQSLSDDLKAWGVPDDDIYFEAFGAAKTTVAETGESYTVTLSKSNKVLNWDASEGSLLELAENNEIPLESACRAGQCGMCKVKITQGEVEYLTEPSASIEADSCLSCISIPKGDISLAL